MTLVLKRDTEQIRKAKQTEHEENNEYVKWISNKKRS